MFVSSHLMSEMQNTADHLIVIGRGQLLADCTMEEFIARSSGQTVRVATRRSASWPRRWPRRAAARSAAPTAR